MFCVLNECFLDNGKWKGDIGIDPMQCMTAYDKFCLQYFLELLVNYIYIYIYSRKMIILI